MKRGGRFQLKGGDRILEAAQSAAKRKHHQFILCKCSCICVAQHSNKREPGKLHLWR